MGTDDYWVKEDIEVKAKNKLGAWLTSFQGWGLLSSMLPNTKHRHFILALAYTSANWNESTGGEQTDEKVFDAVKAVFDALAYCEGQVQGRPMGSKLLGVQSRDGDGSAGPSANTLR